MAEVIDGILIREVETKNILKLPCSTEQKLELVDAVVKHLKEQA